mmetsp:Transcript_33819/g.58941  ORF Transcript_33819/g.58941 Transcript_33819/m.58941 type:complete len:291 (+) Transcript_33819:677-1549(+)|eukprot:CAMPEP_0204898918 /NCGR_PEP_ID=MMETSP1397-20131031/1554_1 /ASSEMBLY_ACC=CAM_ASM_000891 /TAXON_ID=49980 /ORGANISM="Climacostomum Climacostomum virens, Strain Stock W-24" /LENGTH=290 /DNA_ID=CAMNT_0052066809 /DNA_START=651 /DNA_END=1523 /DNA_ORIENTATION=+
MGSAFGKKKTAISLKTQNTFTRAEETRNKLDRPDESASSNSSFGTLGAEDTPPYSPRVVTNRNIKGQKDESTHQEPVRHIDITATSKILLGPKKRAEMRIMKRRTVITTNVVQKQRVHTVKAFDFSEPIEIEQIKPDDPYDKLENKRYSRKLSVLDNPDVKVTSMKLLRTPKHTRRNTEMPTSLIIFSGLTDKLKEARTLQFSDKAPEVAKEELIDLIRMEEISRKSLHKLPSMKSSSTTYRLTHRRTVSQKYNQPVDDVHWSALNSKRAERVWQWKGAYGSLARVNKAG